MKAVLKNKLSLVVSFFTKKKKLIRKICIIILLLTLISTILSHRVIEFASRNKTYNTTQEIPHNKVGLVLGAVKTLADGQLNLYYKYRLEAALELYEAHKVDYLLISGDNSREDYDEPTTMKNDLAEKGVPKDKIYLDYAGFRTLDSIVRSKEIFGQEAITIISQEFHNERAIFIAKQKGIKAVGYNAKDVSLRHSPRIYARERLARVKVMLDLIFGKDPKFLGDSVEIGNIKKSES